MATPTKICACCRPAQAVVELRDDAAADGAAELAKRARPLGDRHGEQRFARFAELGPLGDEAQTIEVHVGAAQHRDEPLPARAPEVGTFAFDPRLEARRPPARRPAP